MILDAQTRVCTNIHDYLDNQPLPPGDWSYLTHGESELMALIRDIEQLQSRMADNANNDNDVEDVLKATYISTRLNMINMLTELMLDMINLGTSPSLFLRIRARRKVMKNLGVLP